MVDFLSPFLVVSKPLSPNLLVIFSRRSNDMVQELRLLVKIALSLDKVIIILITSSLLIMSFCQVLSRLGTHLAATPGFGFICLAVFLCFFLNL